MSSQPQTPGGSLTPMSGPPYLAPVAMPGLVPTKSTDVPIAAVLMAIFVGLFVSNILILRQNKRAGTPFGLTVLLIIYSVLRTVAMIMRIVYATDTHNVNLTIVANVLANAGVILIIILNLLLMPQLFRAYFGGDKIDARPGLKKLTTLPFYIAIPFVPIFLLVTVNVVILTFFTTDMQVRQNCLTAQKVALTTFAVIAFIPAIPALAVAILGSGTPRVRTTSGFASRILNPPQGFGSIRTTALIILFGSVILTLGSSIRTAALMLPARMANDPAWYHKRPAYYIFTFVTEILVVSAYVLFRIDRRFLPAAQYAAEKQPQEEVRDNRTSEERRQTETSSSVVEGYTDRKGDAAESV